MQRGNKDCNIPRNIIVLTAVLAGTMALPASAGDEDMNPTAYQQFDPITGYMIPIENPPQAQQNHNTSTSTQASEEQQVATETASAIMPAGATPTEEPSSSSSFWLYLLAAIVIIGGLAAWIRRGTRHQPGNLD